MRARNTHTHLQFKKALVPYCSGPGDIPVLPLDTPLVPDHLLRGAMHEVSARTNARAHTHTHCTLTHTSWSYQAEFPLYSESKTSRSSVQRKPKRFYLSTRTTPLSSSKDGVCVCERGVQESGVRVVVMVVVVVVVGVRSFLTLPRSLARAPQHVRLSCADAGKSCK